MIVWTRKFKSFPYDIYECTGCGRIWSSRAKKIGHGETACKAYAKKNGWA